MTYWEQFVQRLPFGLFCCLGVLVAQPVTRIGSERGGVWWLVPIGAFVLWVAIAAYLGARVAARERIEERRRARRRRREEAHGEASDRDGSASP